MAPREGSVFTREVLGSIEELTEAAWRTPHSTRVDSLTNFTHSEAFGEDDLTVGPLVEDAGSLSDAALARVESIAVKEIGLVGRLVSTDGRVGGLTLNFLLPENSDLAVIEITDHINALLTEARVRHPDISYYLTGDVVMNRVLAAATAADLETLVPIVFLIIVQNLLLYELSLPLGNDLNDRVDVAKSATRMTVAANASARGLRELDERAREWVGANAPGLTG